MRSSRSLRPLVAAGLLLVMCQALAVPQARPAPQQATTGLIIPLFSYQPAEVSQIIGAKLASPTVPMIVVINPADGPGPAYDSAIATGVTEMQQAGISVFGYVPSGWGEASISVMEPQMLDYENWYHVDGIYLDQMSNWEFNSNNVYLPTYYSTLTTYARSIGIKTVVGNSGADVPYYFIGSVDVIGIYENNGEPTFGALSGNMILPGWHGGYNKDNFFFVAYGVTSLNPDYLLTASNYVGYLYLTNGTFGQSYYSLPSYLGNLTSTLASIVPITVVAETSAGALVDGAFTVRETQPDGSSYSCVAPCTLDAYLGTTVTLSVGTHGYQFDDWGDGYTNSTRTVTVAGPEEFYVHASVTPAAQVPVTLLSTDSDGTPVTGLVAEARFSNGSLAANGTTPLTFQAVRGTTYDVEVVPWGDFRFSHWSTGSNSLSLAITPNTGTELDAFFSGPSHENLTSITANTLSISNNSIVPPQSGTSSTSTAPSTTKTTSSSAESSTTTSGSTSSSTAMPTQTAQSTRSSTPRPPQTQTSSSAGASGSGPTHGASPVTALPFLVVIVGVILTAVLKLNPRLTRTLFRSKGSRRT